MSFNYHKNKEHASDSFWTSYSDLFLGLSTIFLLLYVTASLRTGTDGLRNQIENEKLSMKVQELEQQLKMYESVKSDYLAKEASQDEAQEYQELMDKLTLLQEDAKSEKDRLVQEAFQNEKKVKALNKYQQMVRNVLNANKMAKAKIINRNDLIKEQDVEIETKEVQIADLNKDIQIKKDLIADGEKQIEETQAALQRRVTQLRQAYKTNKLSKQLFEQRMAQARNENQVQVQKLSESNAVYQQQLVQSSRQLGLMQDQLTETQGLLAKKEGETRSLQGHLAKTKAEAGAQIASLQQGIADARSAGAQRLAAEQAASGERLAAERAAGSARLAAQRAASGAQLASLSGQLDATKGQLSATQGQLAKARAEIEARKSVAGEIQRGFAKAGIKADIDMESGDVVLDFGQAYFDSDSDRLKQEMKSVLEKAMPIYSKSLFGNPKVSNKISAVEIVGFASPTYQGRYVDPQSTRPEDKVALKYNMDLSYRRANAIFGYILEEGNMRFDHQRDLLSLMKVSGRSFLEVMSVQNRNVASAVEFCRVNDCKKAQRVIIRFSMDTKK